MLRFNLFWAVAITSVIGLRNSLRIVSQYAIIPWHLAARKKSDKCKPLLFQVLRLRWKTAAQTSSHVATCNRLQPLAATCPSSHLQLQAATCNLLKPLAQAATCSHLQPFAATSSHLPKQPLAATCTTCSHWQVAASGCFFENQIAHLLRPQGTNCKTNCKKFNSQIRLSWCSVGVQHGSPTNELLLLQQTCWPNDDLR